VFLPGTGNAEHPNYGSTELQQQQFGWSLKLGKGANFIFTW
jgi:hypothetical protein